MVELGVPVYITKSFEKSYTNIKVRGVGRFVDAAARSQLQELYDQRGKYRRDAKKS